VYAPDDDAAEEEGDGHLGEHHGDGVGRVAAPPELDSGQNRGLFPPFDKLTFLAAALDSWLRFASCWPVPLATPEREKEQ
jgi:hypothetical protein